MEGICGQIPGRKVFSVIEQGLIFVPSGNLRVPRLVRSHEALGRRGQLVGK